MLTSVCVAVGRNLSAVQTPAIQASFAKGQTGPVGEVGNLPFWRRYRDVTLTGLIEAGLGTNLDILAANERIRAAQADLAASQPVAA
jgi:outer membrane protein, multidrug efflux system